MTKFRIATLFEITLVTAIWFSLLRYVPPLGLLLPSLYVSARVVKRSVRTGHCDTKSLTKVGAAAGVLTMYTIGAFALFVILGEFFVEELPPVSWRRAVFWGFIFGYGSISALLGGIIGQWTGLYLAWCSSETRVNDRTLDANNPGDT